MNLKTLGDMKKGIVSTYSDDKDKPKGKTVESYAGG